MSIKQSDNIRNQFVFKESTHNVMSCVYFFILTIIFLSGFVIGAMEDMYLILSICFIATIISTFRFSIQIILIFKLNSLINSVDPTKIPFYITKSWTRKREATKWMGTCMCILIVLLLVISICITSLITKTELEIATAILAVLLLVVLITMYSNIQIIDNNLKISNRKLNLNSIEWIHIKKEQRVFYRTIFVWFITIIFVLPLILMLFPTYRAKIQELINK